VLSGQWLTRTFFRRSGATRRRFLGQRAARDIARGAHRITRLASKGWSLSSFTIPALPKDETIEPNTVPMIAVSS